MSEKKEKIHIYYDMRFAPITFDAAVYFAIAVATCRLAGFERFDVHVIAKEFRQWSHRDKEYGQEIKNWRLHNIICRLPWLIPDVENISLYRANDIELEWPRYPETYSPGNKNEFPHLFSYLLKVHEKGGNVQIYRPSKFADKWAKNRIGKNDTLIMALRTADFDTGRDSNLSLWHEIYKKLQGLGYRIIVVPDYMDCLNEKKYSYFSWEACPEAALDADLRLALSTNAYATFGSSGGHFVPILLSSATFLIFGLINKFGLYSKGEFVSKILGIESGGQPTFFHDHQQKYDWQEASLLTVDYVSSTVERFLENIRRSPC